MKVFRVYHVFETIVAEQLIQYSDSYELIENKELVGVFSNEDEARSFVERYNEPIVYDTVSFRNAFGAYVTLAAHAHKLIVETEEFADDPFEDSMIRQREKNMTAIRTQINDAKYNESHLRFPKFFGKIRRKRFDRMVKYLEAELASYSTP